MTYNVSQVDDTLPSNIVYAFVFFHSTDVTCNSVDSDKSNVFETYNVNVSGSTSYNLTFDPAEYGPTNRLPVGTKEVTVTASSPSTAIGSCTFNVTVSCKYICFSILHNYNNNNNHVIPVYSDIACKFVG